MKIIQVNQCSQCPYLRMYERQNHCANPKSVEYSFLDELVLEEKELTTAPPEWCALKEEDKP